MIGYSHGHGQAATNPAKLRGHPIGLSIYNPSSSMIFSWSKPTTDWPSIIVTGAL